MAMRSLHEAYSGSTKDVTVGAGHCDRCQVLGLSGLAPPGVAACGQSSRPDAGLDAKHQHQQLQRLS